MAKVERSITVNAQPDRVWALVTEPAKWHTWFEGATEAKSVHGDGKVGTVVEHGITISKIPLPAQTTIVTFDPGICWKGEFTGPATKGYMQWDYHPVNSQTELVFTIEAELSGPAKLAEKIVIGSFETMAEKTLENIKKMVEN